MPGPNNQLFAFGMPPGPAYNWLCVVCSAADILSRAARIRATQLAHQSSPLTAKKPNETLQRGLQKSLDTLTSDGLDATDVHPTHRTADAGIEKPSFSLQVPPPSLAFASPRNVENLTLQETRFPSESHLEASGVMERLTLGEIQPQEVLLSSNPIISTQLT